MKLLNSTEIDTSTKNQCVVAQKLEPSVKEFTEAFTCRAA